MTLFTLVARDTAAERWIAQRDSQVLEVYWDGEASGLWPNGPGWSYRLYDCGELLGGDVLDVTNPDRPGGDVEAQRAALIEAGWAGPDDDAPAA